jgi:hypothetical protein
MRFLITTTIFTYQQRFNASSICLSPCDGVMKEMKRVARVYPGNYQMLKENLNAEVNFKF